MKALPIDSYLASIQDSYQRHSNLVVVAEPGAGKTTRLPPALLTWNGIQKQKKVLVLVPRRIAAQLSADRVCFEQGWQLGKECGYQVRFDSKVQADTKLIFLTEALLVKKMLTDPELKDVAAVVLDEFHERSIWTDLTIGLLKECQQLSRPDLKIVVMSATLDSQQLSKYLATEQGPAPVVNVPGQVFPMEVEYQKESQLILTSDLWQQKVSEKIIQIMLRSPADTLIFLPGVFEINRIRDRISEKLPEAKFEIRVLHGQQSLSEQKANLQKIPVDANDSDKHKEKCRIILCTNVAESSVTVDGVSQVIDSGLHKSSRYNLKTDVNRLETVRISKASATQRAGRAARQGPGRVFRLWNQLDERSMVDFESAEIHRSNLVDVVLMLSSVGVSPETFDWFERPNKDFIKFAVSDCERLGLIKSGQISELGLQILKYPLPARIAVAHLKSLRLGHHQMGAALSALLSEREENAKSVDHDDCDLKPLLQAALMGNCSFQIRKVMDQLLQVDGSRSIASKQTNLDEDPLLQVLWTCFKDRLCRRRRTGEPQAMSTSGRAYTLSQNSRVKKADYFFALKLMELEKSNDVVVTMACSVSEEWIKRNVSGQAIIQKEVLFDEKNKTIYVEEFKAVDHMPLENPRRRSAKAEEVADLLPSLLLKKWDYVIAQNQRLKNNLCRFFYYDSKCHQIGLSDDLLLRAMQAACIGENQFEIVLQKDLWYYIEQQLQTEFADQFQVSDFEKSCPGLWKSPTGKTFTIYYENDKGPWVEVKIQDCFGLKKQPKVFKSEQALTFHLLGPNMRPVQVTSDIDSFWDNTYPEIRSQYKIKYPKHKWPEDPRNF